jgi:uncharacterized protein YbjT (DUF2867 family)
VRVLVYGATGSQMRPLVAQLLDRGYDVSALSRKGTSSPPLPVQVQVLKGDVANRESLLAASQGADVVAFMLPAFLEHPENALEYASNAASAAAAAGVSLMVWNTSGRYPLPGESRRSDALMLALHERLAAADVPLIVVAPTTYMENLLGPWTVNAIRSGRVAYPVLPERKMGWIASRDLCALLAAAIERPHLAGQLFRVSGIEAVTGPELAGIFSEALQRPLSYQTLSPQEMKDALEAAFGPGSGDAVAKEYALDQADQHPPLKHYEMSEVLAALPVRMTQLREWIAEHRAAFAPI